jgi:hypothetical protein
MADSTSNLDLLIQSQSSKEVTANAFFDAASPAALYGRRQSTTSGLTWGYYGGRFNTLSIANGTIALTASATNYIEADTSTGAVSKNTAGWTGAGKKRLYKVTTGASSVTNYEDFREVEIPVGLTTEDVDDRVSSLLVAGTNVSLTYNDGTNTLTIDVPSESIDDRVAALLQAGSGISLTYNDASNTLTITSTASGGMTNPMTASGDIITGGASGAPQRLAKGTDGQVLTLVSGAPAWQDSTGGSAGTNIGTVIAIADLPVLY